LRSYVALADGGVNVLALSIPETDSTRGNVRLLVANRELATVALTRAGYSFEQNEVIFVELKNRPGALARTVEKLARATISVRSLYVTTYPKARRAAAVIAVGGQDLDRAVVLVG
jgi:hypothetical protein